MTTNDESNDQRQPSQESRAPKSSGTKSRLLLLIGLLALAVFALWYDYKVARPAVEQAYERIAAVNSEINSTSDHRRMTNADVQAALNRAPSETFVSGKYTVEAYRWRAGMLIELRGLKGDESPGIGLKTHDYYAVYRKDGPELAFVTHFKFNLDSAALDESRLVAATGDGAANEEGEPEMMPGMGGGGPGGGGPGGGGPGGGGPGGGGGFDPEAMFARRDVDGDGKLTGEEISERMRENLEAIDTDGDGAVSKEELLARMSQFRGRGGRGGPGGEGGGPGRGPGGEGEGRRQRPPLESSADEPADQTPASDVPPSSPAKEDPADTTTEEAASEPPAGAPAKPSEEPAKEEKASDS